MTTPSQDNDTNRPRGLGVLVFLAPFCLYLQTMAPTVYGLDSAELTTGAHTLGITHSPGAPLFMLLGHCFCFLPLGDIGWRINLVSVTASALGAFFVYAVLRRLTGRIWIAVTGAWLLAVSYYIWAWAVVAELYALHLCLVTALIWLVVKWRQTGRSRLLIATGILGGLGMGNHTSLCLVVPGLAWLVITALSPRRPSRVLIAPVLLAILSFTGIFLYLPLRHAAHPALDYVRDYFPQINLSSPEGWFWMVRGGMFESLFFSTSCGEAWSRLIHLNKQFVANFGLGVTLLAVIGLIAGWRGRREERQVVMAGLILFIFHTGFYLTYGALDWIWMFSISYLVLVLFAGLGLAALERRLSSPAPPHVLPARMVLRLFTTLIVLRLAWFNYPRLNLSHDTTARMLGERMFAIMEPKALFIGLWEHEPLLAYLQIVEQQRPDVHIINGVFMGPAGSLQQVNEALLKGRPVYTAATNLLTGAFTFTLCGDTPCYRVRPVASTPAIP